MHVFLEKYLLHYFKKKFTVNLKIFIFRFNIYILLSGEQQEPAPKKVRTEAGAAVPTPAEVREVAGASKQPQVISEDRYKHFMRTLYKLVQEKYQVGYLVFYLLLKYF